jgi:hypothetical protein
METIPLILEAAWARAYPGREAAERNTALRELQRHGHVPKRPPEGRNPSIRGSLARVCGWSYPAENSAPIDAMAALAAVPGKVLNPKLALPALTMCWWCRPVEPVCWPV